MPCDIPSHPHHEWPATGKLRIYSCEIFCNFCTGEKAKHNYGQSKRLREHVGSHIRREYPDLQMEWPGGYRIVYEGPLVGEMSKEQTSNGVKRSAASPIPNDREGFQPSSRSDRPFGWSLSDGPFNGSRNIQPPRTPVSLKAYASAVTAHANSTSPSQASSKSAGTSLNSRTTQAPSTTFQSAKSHISNSTIPTAGAPNEVNGLIPDGETRVYAPLGEVHKRFKNQIIASIEFGRALGLTTSEMGWHIDEAMRTTLPHWLADETESRGEEADKGECEDYATEDSVVDGEEGEEGDGDWDGDCSRL